MRYKVIHASVAVRERPCMSARTIGRKVLGDTFHATVAKDGWVRITGGPNLGWVLADGRDASEAEAHCHGRLLLPLKGGATRAATDLVVGLPPELQPAVMAVLEVRDILRLRQACRSLRLSTCAPELWHELAQRRWQHIYGDEPPPPGRDVWPPFLTTATVVDAATRLVALPALMLRDRTADAVNVCVEMVARNVCIHFRAERPARPRLASPFTPHIFEPLPPVVQKQRMCFGERPYPQMQLNRPQAPLPFASAASAVASNHDGWALRTLAYFEITLDAAVPTGGSVLIGLIDEVIAADQANATDEPRVSGALGQDGGHSIVWRLEGAAPGVVTDGLAPWAHATEPPVSVLLFSDRQGRQVERRVPTGAAAGDTLGCGIDYARGRVLWTHNGRLLSEHVNLTGELADSSPFGLHTGWRPCVAAEGDVAVRVNLGGGCGDECVPFAYSTLVHEQGVWAHYQGNFNLKRQFEEHTNSAGAPLDPDESKRGWPWVHTGWEAAVERHVTPWLRRLEEAGLSPADVAARKAREVLSPSWSWPHEDSPIYLPLWPQPDPLGLLSTEREELVAFVERAALPAAVSSGLASAGLSLSRLAALPAEAVSALLCRLSPPQPTGVRLRLRSALKCELGVSVELHIGAPSTSPLPGKGVLPEGTVGRSARIWYLPRPCLMIVSLAPELPVRERPEMASAELGVRRWGEAVIAIAECRGWLELRPAVSPIAHEGGWVLWDGRQAGHTAPLLCPLRRIDSAVLSGRRAVWPPHVYPCHAAKGAAEFRGLLAAGGPSQPSEATNAAAGANVGLSSGSMATGQSKSGAVDIPLEADSMTGALHTPSSDGSSAHASLANSSAAHVLLSEIAARGANLDALSRLARHDRPALTSELRTLGVTKVGTRLLVLRALLDAASARPMPSISSELQRRRDERELGMLVRLAELPEHHVTPLLASGLHVRRMHDEPLEVLEELAAGCASLQPEERLLLLDTVHEHVHRRASLLDEGVMRILKGGEAETLTATLAATTFDRPAVAAADGTVDPSASRVDCRVLVARAVRGGMDASVDRSSSLGRGGGGGSSGSGDGAMAASKAPRVLSSPRLAVDVSPELPLRGQPAAGRTSHVRFVVFSDTRGMHRQLDLTVGSQQVPHLGSADTPPLILACLGNFTADGSFEQVVDFLDWFGAQPAAHRLLLTGELDAPFVRAATASAGRHCCSTVGSHSPGLLCQRLRSLFSAGGRITWLTDERLELDGGLRVHGISWSEGRCTAASGRCAAAREDGEPGAAAGCPAEGGVGADATPMSPGVDVLLTHASPAGCLDCGGGTGSSALAEVAKCCLPTVHCFSCAPNRGRICSRRRLQSPLALVSGQRVATHPGHDEVCFVNVASPLAPSNGAVDLRPISFLLRCPPRDHM